MKKEMNNKGFSLVELIIVIAIMAVLVGVLAPQFMKYVEQSRKATDISNASMIRDAVLADIADAKITGSGTKTFDGSALSVSAIATSDIPKVQGNLLCHGNNFSVTYDASAGTCSVTLTEGSVTYTLTDATSAGFYKSDTTPTAH